MIRTFARAFRAECRRILDAWQATDETPTAEAAVKWAGDLTDPAATAETEPGPARTPAPPDRGTRTTFRRPRS